MRSPWDEAMVFMDVHCGGMAPGRQMLENLVDVLDAHDRDHRLGLAMWLMVFCLISSGNDDGAHDGPMTGRKVYNALHLLRQVPDTLQALLIMLCDDPQVRRLVTEKKKGPSWPL